MPLTAIRGKTECPRRVSVSLRVGFGEVLAADVVQLSSADTVEGQSVNIATDDAGVRINDANVIATDVMASNGVIHVIDSVLIPSS